MSFITDIWNYNSLSIVGLAKNTGKTECLNYILRHVKSTDRQIAITSVGVDGEQRDQVNRTSKPEIEVPEGVIFVTSEKHFREKKLTAEIMDISEANTALGRLVTARAVAPGKVLLSGPSDTAGLKKMIKRLKNAGVHTTLVDGALSRLSLASPAVTDAMVLTTGAAVSGNVSQLVRQTRYVYDLIGLEKVEQKLVSKLEVLNEGVWAIDENGRVQDLNIRSALMLPKSDTDLFRYGNRIYVAGVVTDQLLKYLRMQRRPIELIVRDFTRIFALQVPFYAFLEKWGQVKVLHKSKLLAVTVNPLSPLGFMLDSGELCEKMQQGLKVPVYDVKNIEE